MANIDNLTIGITASATNAVNAITSLETALGSLSKTLSTVSTGKNFKAFSTNVGSLGNALKTLSNIDKRTFDNVTAKLTGLGTSASSVSQFATSMEKMGVALSSFKIPQDTATSLQAVSNVMRSFGYKGIGSAIANLPALTSELQNLLNTLSSAKKVDASVISSLEQVSNLFNSLGGVKAGSSGNSGILPSQFNIMREVSNTVGNAMTKLGDKLQKLTPIATKSKLSLTELASAFGILYASLFWVKRIVSVLTSVMTSFSDYIESFNFWDVAITNSVNQDTVAKWSDAGYTSAQKYAEGLESGLADLNTKMTGFVTDVVDGTGDISIAMVSNLGLSITALTQFEAKITSVASSLGLASDTANTMAKSLSMLAGDISSLYNVDLDTAMTSLNSGIIGQSRSLYKYGIDITNNTLQQYALANGISKTVSSMSQSEKMQLRMLAILDQSKVSWGDLANTINNYANQVRVLQNGIKNLGSTIGRILVPVITNVMPYLNATVKLLQECALWVANLTGVKFSGDSAISAVDTGVEDLDDSLSDASDSAKSLKQQLLGIDEINNISDSSSSSSGAGSSGTIDLSSQIADAYSEYESVWEKAYAGIEDKATKIAQKIKEIFKTSGFGGLGKYFGESLADALDDIPWSKIKDGAKKIGTNFAKFLNEFITPKSMSSVGTTIAESLNTVLNLEGGFLDNFNFENLGHSIGSGINSFFKTYDFKRAGDNFNELIDGIVTALAECLRTITWDDVIKDVKDFLGELSIPAWTVLLSVPALKLGGNILTSSLMQNLILSKMIGSAVGGGGSSALLSSAMNGALSIALPITISLVVGSVIGSEIQKKVTDSVTDFLSHLGTEGIGGATGKLEIVFGNLFSKEEREAIGATNKSYTEFTQSVSDSGMTGYNVARSWQNSSAMTSQAFEGIKTTLNKFTDGAFSNFKKDLVSLPTYLEENAFKPLKEKIGNIPTFLKNTFNKAIPYIQGFVNGVIDAINDLTYPFRTIGNGIASLFGITEAIPAISHVTIQKFENGGFIEDGLFTMNKGEIVGGFNGKSAVANNEQIVEGISSGVKSAVESVLVPYLAQLVDSNNEIANKDVEVSSNGIFRSVRKSARVYQKSTGKNAFSF